MATEIHHVLPDGRTVEALDLKFSYDVENSCTIRTEDGATLRLTVRPTAIRRFYDDDGNLQHELQMSAETNIVSPPDPRYDAPPSPLVISERVTA